MGACILSDYQNEREKHLEAVIANLLNWEFAADNFEKRAVKRRATA
jgi:superoxide dismutase